MKYRNHGTIQCNEKIIQYTISNFFRFVIVSARTEYIQCTLALPYMTSNSFSLCEVLRDEYYYNDIRKWMRFNEAACCNPDEVPNPNEIVFHYRNLTLQPSCKIIETLHLVSWKLHQMQWRIFYFFIQVKAILSQVLVVF
jgi:hypothetical protein